MVSYSKKIVIQMSVKKWLQMFNDWSETLLESTKE